MVDGSAGAFNMQDIGNILNQLVQEQRTQQTRLEELGRGVLGAQAVTEGVIGSIVDQVQGAFQQQQQHTQDQVTQIAGAVQQLQSQLQQFVQSAGNLAASAAGSVPDGSLAGGGGPQTPPGPPGLGSSGMVGCRSRGVSDGGGIFGSLPQGPGAGAASGLGATGASGSVPHWFNQHGGQSSRR